MSFDHLDEMRYGNLTEIILKAAVLPSRHTNKDLCSTDREPGLTVIMTAGTLKRCCDAIEINTPAPQAFTWLQASVASFDRASLSASGVSVLGLPSAPLRLLFEELFSKPEGDQLCSVTFAVSSIMFLTDRTYLTGKLNV